MIAKLPYTIISITNVKAELNLYNIRFYYLIKMIAKMPYTIISITNVKAELNLHNIRFYYLMRFYSSYSILS